MIINMSALCSLEDKKYLLCRMEDKLHYDHAANLYDVVLTRYREQNGKVDKGLGIETSEFLAYAHYRKVLPFKRRIVLCED